MLERLKQLAAERPRFGYRRLTTLLRREGMLVNPKKVYRLCTKEGLLVRPKKRKPRTRSSFRPEVPALERPNQLWSLDFVEDALADGRKLRTLTIVDVYSRECPQIEVDTSLPGLRVVRVLEKLASRRQFPERLLVDNGPEFICRALWPSGPPSAGCSSPSPAQANRPTSRTSKASTGDFETNASTHTTS